LNGIQGENELTAVGAEAVCRVLQSNTTLVNLNLHKNHIGDSGLQHLADVLPTSHLHMLDVSENDIAEASSLARGLAAARNLRVLHLSDNALSVGSVAALSAALSLNASLLEIRLHNVGLSDGAGINAIYTALERNKALTKIDLRRNKLRDLHGLAAALKVNRRLLDVDLRRNEIDDDGFTQIREALRVNFALLVLSVHGNRLGDHVYDFVTRKMERNAKMRPKNIHDIVLNFCIAFYPLRLPPTILLCILDFLPHMAIAAIEEQKMSIIRACARSIARLRGESAADVSTPAPTDQSAASDVAVRSASPMVMDDVPPAPVRNPSSKKRKVPEIEQ
jgi:Ran GTPase-activating protein (RanGAP) involved in mRNA processing and transport